MADLQLDRRLRGRIESVANRLAVEVGGGRRERHRHLPAPVAARTGPPSFLSTGVPPG
jgi:hypothetical protein